MKCPACSTDQTLQVSTAPEGLRTRRCPSCDGCWVRSQDYWRWMSQRVAESSPAPVESIPTSGAPRELGHRFCPEDGYTLERFEVGAPHAFLIDQCGNCSGAWLDAGEWEALCEGGLADRLHLILSEEWQDQLQAARRDDGDGARWSRELGPADLARITEIKEWLDEHPKRGELYAFLRFHERAM